MSETAFSHRSLYKFSRIGWSIYFVLGIGAIGGTLGYSCSAVLFLLSLLLSPIPKISTPIRHLAEYIICLSIRLLLRLQPWLICKTNLPPITGFYDHFKTRRILFVANHRSNLDTFLLISFIPGLRGLAKRSLFYNIFFGPFMFLAGFIPVEKGSPESFVTGLGHLRDKLLRRERPVLIFPENTRCEKGFPSVKKFGSAIFAIAIESEALIVPLVIKDTDKLMGRGDLFVNPFQAVEVNMLAPVAAAGYTDAQKLRDEVWNLIRADL